MRKRIFNAIVLVIMLGLMYGSIQGSFYEEHRNCYYRENLSDVVEFDIPQVILDASTSVTSLSEKMENGLYRYKDDCGTYLLFDMNSFFIMIQVNSKCYCNNINVIEFESGLESMTINSIRFVPTSDNYYSNIKKAVYKNIIEVTAYVPFSSQKSQMFTGMFASIGNAKLEYTIFVGVTDTNSEDSFVLSSNMINHIVKSFQFTDTAIVSNANESIIFDNTNFDRISYDSGTFEEELLIRTIKSNQRRKKEMHTSLYNMASLGDVEEVIAQVYSEDKLVEHGYVKPISIISGKSAENIIQNYYKNSSLKNEYHKSRIGTRWEVLEYETSIDPNLAYLDIRVEGVDGMKLICNGLAYSMKTFDILDYNMVYGDGFRKCFCFYEVPDDCEEYLIEMGIFALDDIRDYNAYYLINRNNYRSGN